MLNTNTSPMKKLLLLLLTVNMGFAQWQTVQIKLVDPTVGGVHYYYLDGGVMGSIGNTSEDAGLNQIFLTHNIASYYDGYGNYNFEQGYYTKLMDCYNCNVNQLVADLAAYSAVITKVNISPEPTTFSDVAFFKTATPDLFHITGTDANNIITTDNTLVNQIFQARNVYTCDSGSLWKHLVCDCNVGELMADLVANSIVNPNTINSENIPIHDNYYYESVVSLLANKDFKNSTAKVYPNPFATTFTIDSKEKINQYFIYDITGKLLIASNSKTDLDNQTLTLQSGVYVLQLETANGSVSNQKLIKK